MSHSKRVLLTATLMCLAFCLGCGKGGEENAPAPAPAPAPGQPTPPTPPGQGGGGLPATVEAASPGTPVSQMQNTQTYFDTLTKNVTSQGTGTVSSKTKGFYTVNWNQQGGTQQGGASATLSPSASNGPAVDNEPMSTLGLHGWFQQSWGGWWPMGWGSIAVDPNPTIPQGFSFTETIEVVPNSNLLIHSTDQVALFRGSQSGFAQQWILKVLVGPANPPMQIFFVDAMNQQSVFVRQLNISTSFRTN